MLLISLYLFRLTILPKVRFVPNLQWIFSSVWTEEMSSIPASLFLYLQEAPYPMPTNAVMLDHLEHACRLLVPCLWMHRLWSTYAPEDQSSLRERPQPMLQGSVCGLVSEPHLSTNSILQWAVKTDQLRMLDPEASPDTLSACTELPYKAIGHVLGVHTQVIPTRAHLSFTLVWLFHVPFIKFLISLFFNFLLLSLIDFGQKFLKSY